jgi:hypothetical protein
MCLFVPPVIVIASWIPLSNATKLTLADNGSCIDGGGTVPVKLAPCCWSSRTVIQMLNGVFAVCGPMSPPPA